MTDFIFIVEVEDQFVKIGHFEIIGDDTRVSRSTIFKDRDQDALVPGRGK